MSSVLLRSKLRYCLYFIVYLFVYHLLDVFFARPRVFITLYGLEFRYIDLVRNIIYCIAELNIAGGVASY